jgi:hypothetical protein
VRGTDRRSEGSASRVRRYVGVVAAIAVGLVVVGCSSGPANQAPAGQAGGQPAASASASAAALAADLKITPASGSRDVTPSAGITVTATQGKVTNVTVKTSGDPVTGTLSDGDQTWHSLWALNTGRTYTVTATRGTTRPTASACRSC